MRGTSFAFLMRKVVSVEHELPERGESCLRHPGGPRRLRDGCRDVCVQYLEVVVGIFVRSWFSERSGFGLDVRPHRFDHNDEVWFARDWERLSQTYVCLRILEP